MLEKIYNKLVREWRQLQTHLTYMFFNRIPIYWYSGKTNFGDLLNCYLVEKISGKKVQPINPSDYRYKNFFVIGSIFSNVNKHSVVWGIGLISRQASVRVAPDKVLAVRGPLTRQRLLELAIDCPEVYGDPALLLPRYFSPQINKKYKLGIIPHYVDKDHPWIKQINQYPQVKVIDIQTDNIEDFVRQLLQCEKIISSSLHGIVVADAYNVPSKWLELSKNVKGDGFKFKDYFLSVKRNISAATLTDPGTDLNTLLAGFTDYKISIDLNKLLQACPFVK